MNLPEIYTDGSCLKNPGGPGGWAFTVLENKEQWTVSGGEQSTTNNRMELQAIIEALEFVQGNEYIIYTDSELTMKCATGIYKRKSNKDLWERYDKALDCRKINWVWVKSHNGNCMNEYVDCLARQEAELLKKIK
jgi:ribonuclease HI